MVNLKFEILCVRPVFLFQVGAHLQDHLPCSLQLQVYGALRPDQSINSCQLPQLTGWEAVSSRPVTPNGYCRLDAAEHSLGRSSYCSLDLLSLFHSHPRLLRSQLFIHDDESKLELIEGTTAQKPSNLNLKLVESGNGSESTVDAVPLIITIEQSSFHRIRSSTTEMQKKVYNSPRTINAFPIIHFHLPRRCSLLS
jgi:hypothetical protein